MQRAAGKKSLRGLFACGLRIYPTGTKHGGENYDIYFDKLNTGLSFSPFATDGTVPRRPRRAVSGHSRKTCPESAEGCAALASSFSQAENPGKDFLLGMSKSLSGIYVQNPASLVRFLLPHHSRSEQDFYSTDSQPR